jgi:prolipoprotein diacylglyceryltransferase
MDLVSTSLGSFLYWRLSKNDGISPSMRVSLLIGTTAGALIGSRLLGSLENPSLFLQPPTLLYYYASKTIIGGIAGGILGMEIGKKIIGYRSSTGDKIAIPLLVAILVGRIGCLFTGVIDGTVGNACNYFWCFNQGDGIARHPTSLYEIVFVFLLIIIVLQLQKKRLYPGVIFRVSIISYFLFRFFIEFIKPINSFVFEFSAIQVVCILYAIWYAYDIKRIISKYT